MILRYDERAEGEKRRRERKRGERGRGKKIVAKRDKEGVVCEGRE